MLTPKKLSIIIPAFNEEAFIGQLLRKILEVPTESLGMEKEIILVNDCSTDRTLEIASKFPQVKCYTNEKNMGKGASVKRGISLSTGDHILIQDADLEYDPGDYTGMVKALNSFGPATIIYGSRTLGQKRQKAGKGIFSSKHPDQDLGPFIAGKLLSLWTFILFGKWITDTLTGYKLYPGPAIKKFTIETHGFETDHELTAKLIRSGFNIREVPINYFPRTKEQGKKIRSKDFFTAVWTLLKFRMAPTIL